MDRACRVQKMHIDPCCGLTFVKVGAEAWTKVENGDFLSKNSKWSLLLFKDIQLIKAYQKYSKVHNPLSPTKIEPRLFGCPSSKGQRFFILWEFLSLNAGRSSHEISGHPAVNATKAHVSPWRLHRHCPTTLLLHQRMMMPKNNCQVWGWFRFLRALVNFSYRC